jgi:hypothetical protein
MTYRTGLVACIKTGGKVLREVKDQVFLPFGKEYSILIKNLKSLRVMVKVSIDGADVTDGNSLIIEPNSELELERFIRNGNLNKGNRFKFIKRTTEIEDYRGIRVDDGIVRIEYWTEQPLPVVRSSVHYYDPYVWWPNPYISYLECASAISVNCDSTISVNCVRTSQSSSSVSNNLSTSTNTMNMCNNVDPGITVPGSESNQQFVSGNWFPTDNQSEVVILRLCGQDKDHLVKTPVVVRTKLVCSTCGKSNKSTMKYCGVCGTALEII